MNIWRSFSGSRDGEGTRGGPAGVFFDDPSGRADCGFCGRRGLEREASAPSPYPVWRCACGAIGSGATLWDLDEAADELLRELSIDARAGEAAIPTDHPAIFIRRFDADRVERNMQGILEEHGYAFVAAARPRGNVRTYWAKGVAAAEEQVVHQPGK